MGISAVVIVILSRNKYHWNTRQLSWLLIMPMNRLMKLSDKKIEQIKLYLADKPLIRAYLFGTFVRREGKVGSDIDLLVELDYSQKIGLLFIQMKLDLEEFLNEEVDLDSENAVSRHLKPVIDAEKELIYAQ